MADDICSSIDLAYQRVSWYFFQVIDIDLPITVKLTVVDVDPGLKGDTAQGDTISFNVLV